LFQKLDAPKTREDMVAAVGFLNGRPECTGRVGAVGFCWGGGTVNRIAVAAPDLAAAAVFYGDVPPAADVKKIKAKLLLHYAGLDQRINSGVPAFEAALKEAGVSYRKHDYPNVNHAFHHEGAGARYNADAARLAWNRTAAFFKANLS
jgi:carboxymethylenebutenolidase